MFFFVFLWGVYLKVYFYFMEEVYEIYSSEMLFFENKKNEKYCKLNFIYDNLVFWNFYIVVVWIKLLFC